MASETPISVQSPLAGPTSKRELQAWRKRSRSFAEISDSAARVTQILNGINVPRSEPLVLRRGFSYSETPIAEYAGDDRKTPPREVRPPATRLMNGQGPALRLVLTAISLAQAQDRRPGTTFRNRWPVFPDSPREYGWCDFIASPATTTSNQTKHYITDRRKRKGQVNRALKTIQNAKLIQLPSDKSGRFQLLDETAGASRPHAELMPYSIPSKSEPTLVLPEGFIANGWLHILRDSEIALILMLSCGEGKLEGEDPGLIAIPSDTRLRHYGLGRESFSAAHPILRALGLLKQSGQPRNSAGRIVGFDPEDTHQLHRLQLIPEGFKSDAVEVAREVFGRKVLDSSSRHAGNFD
ncbi:hypothetical protein DFO66_11232 [Brevibacterium sanguinis]|uniref:Uncharacterized protein n=2 Tax=Brevibacterium TaxID=1696 RepID=A0A366IFV0_9MICO|nr:hypothetical protein DFO66_11232 [Brevibacterium sanguinis]RBP69527.1 hypothetical protein DFO65_11261 [Brevibacterium celere]